MTLLEWAGLLPVAETYSTLECLERGAARPLMAHYVSSLAEGMLEGKGQERGGAPLHRLTVCRPSPRECREGGSKRGAALPLAATQSAPLSACVHRESRAAPLLKFTVQRPASPRRSAASQDDAATR